ncbi:TPR-like protein [Cryphonectria parasitica EP155]|uniref:TPR-like protein n=1 Tax=Cryphonectria parasitica (strain ATCC 38755 / EP155) TaxID=660469 RepID=A0A9P5CP86_CRYP1|nr:TPR-like protein [Cryphonectria parasitica EP155]KAF3765152.1 TPR-like protein [Cryphonectria parasitica EP155]
MTDIAEPEIRSRGTQRSSEPDRPSFRTSYVERQYNNSVGFNNGTISNYFILSSDAAHRVDLPGSSSPQDSSDSTEIQTGQALYKSKHWYQSKVIFDKALHSPNSTLSERERNRVRYNLAHAHFALAEFSDATRHFQALVDTHDEKGEEYELAVSDSRFWLGRCFYHRGQYEKASQQFRIFLRTYKEERATSEADAIKATDGRLWLGLTFERLGEYEGATEQLQTAFDIQNEIAPDDLATLACRHHLANFFYKRKEFLRAHQHFHALFHAEERLNGPERGQAVMTRCMLAFCLAKLRRYDEAQPHLERVSDYMNAQPCRTSDQLRDKGLVCYWLGRIAVERMMKHKHRDFVPKATYLLQSARQDISAAIEKDKTNDWLVEDLGDCKHYQAHVMIIRGDFADAEQTFRETIDDTVQVTGERQIASRVGLARSFLEQRKFDEAKSTLEEAVCSTTPIEHCQHTGRDLAACLALLGETYLELEKPSKARDCLQTVVDAVPEMPSEPYTTAQHELAIAMFELRDFAGACKYFQAAYDIRRLQFPQRQDESRSWLAWALCEASRFQEAEPYLRTTLTALPEPPHRTRQLVFVHGKSRYYMGRVLYHQKDWRGAVKHFEDALPLLHAVHKLSLFNLRQQTTKARQILEELLQINPEGEPAAITSPRLISIPYWLGRVFMFQHKPREAEEWFSKGLDISTQEVTYQYARCLFKLDSHGVDRMGESIEAVQGVLDRLPQVCSKEDEELYEDSRWLLGRGFYLTGKFDEARDYLKSSITVLERRYGHDDRSTSFARAILADCLCELQLDSEADLLVTWAANQSDTKAYTDAVLIKAIGSYWLGRRAYKAGRSKEKGAEAHFTAALNLLASYKVNKVRWNRIRFDSRHFLARIKLGHKQYSEAGDLFQELAIQAHEAGELAHAVDNQYYLGCSLSEQGRFDEAFPVFQKVLDGDHDGRLVENASWWSQFQLARCLSHMGKLMEAKDKFAYAAESPDPLLRPRARLRLGQTIFRLDDYEEARDIFQSILDQPDQATAQCISDARSWLARSLSKLEK